MPLTCTLDEADLQAENGHVLCCVHIVVCQVPRAAIELVCEIDCQHVFSMPVIAFGTHINVVHAPQQAGQAHRDNAL